MSEDIVRFAPPNDYCIRGREGRRIFATTNRLYDIRLQALERFETIRSQV